MTKLYRSFLEARIDYANGEYEKYTNTMQMFQRRLRRIFAVVRPVL